MWESRTHSMLMGLMGQEEFYVRLCESDYVTLWSEGSDWLQSHLEHLQPGYSKYRASIQEPKIQHYDLNSFIKLHDWLTGFSKEKVCSTCKRSQRQTNKKSSFTFDSWQLSEKTNWFHWFGLLVFLLNSINMSNKSQPTEDKLWLKKCKRKEKQQQINWRTLTQSKVV